MSIDNLSIIGMVKTYSSVLSYGVVADDEGKLYLFSKGDWMSGEIEPVSGIRVRLVAVSGKARSVTPLPSDRDPEDSNE